MIVRSDFQQLVEVLTLKALECIVINLLSRIIYGMLIW